MDSSIRLAVTEYESIDRPENSTLLYWSIYQIWQSPGWLESLERQMRVSYIGLSSHDCINNSTAQIDNRGPS